MEDIVEFNNGGFEIVNSINQTNNDKAESILHKEAKAKGYDDGNDMYIKELLQMKEELTMVGNSTGRTHQIVKEIRSINNDLEQIIGIKKDKTALYLMNEIRQKGEALYKN